jgi:hypothetical protein
MHVCIQTRDAVLARLIAATHDTASGVSAVACKLISTILTTIAGATTNQARAVSDQIVTVNGTDTTSSSSSSSSTLQWRHEPQLVHACIQALLHVVQCDTNSSSSSGSSVRSQAVAVAAISSITAYYSQFQLPVHSNGYSYTSDSYTLPLQDVISICAAMIAVAQPHIDSEINSSSSVTTSISSSSSNNKSRRASSSSSSGDAEKMAYSAVRALGYLCILLQSATTTTATTATTDTLSNSSSSRSDQQQAVQLQNDSVQLLTRAVQSLAYNASAAVSLVSADVLYDGTTKAVSKHAWCYCKALGTAISCTKSVSNEALHKIASSFSLFESTLRCSICIVHAYGSYSDSSMSYETVYECSAAVVTLRYYLLTCTVLMCLLLCCCNSKS